MRPFPFKPEDLTAAWLTESLRASGAIDRAGVRSFGWAPVDPHNGMTGVLVRLSLDYDVRSPNAPTTLVAKFSQPEPEFRAMVHSMGFFEREVSFYTEFAAEIPVAVPRCYFADVDQEGWSLLLLEDLAPARNGSWVRGSSIGDLRAAVAGIAAVHAAWWQSPRLGLRNVVDHDRLSRSGPDARGRGDGAGNHFWPDSPCPSRRRSPRPGTWFRATCIRFSSTCSKRRLSPWCTTTSTETTSSSPYSTVSPRSLSSTGNSPPERTPPLISAG